MITFFFFLLLVTLSLFTHDNNSHDTASEGFPGIPFSFTTFDFRHAFQMTLSSILFGQRFQSFGDFPSSFGNPGYHRSYPFTQLLTLSLFSLTSLLSLLSSSSSFQRHDCFCQLVVIFLYIFLKCNLTMVFPSANLTRSPLVSATCV